MPYYFAAGEHMNLLGRANAVATSPSAASSFPVANLYDSRPSRPTLLGSNAANPSVTFDLTAFAPSGPGTKTITVRAGERRRLTSTGTTSITVRNLATLKYLTSGGAWQTGSTTCMTTATSLDYQIESLTACQQPTMSLQIVITNGTSVVDHPRWNAIVVAGHNLDAGLTCELRSSTDNFSGSNVLEVTGTILRPSFYMIDTGGIANRYGRLLLTGTNSATPWFGEVVPCWLETAAGMHMASGYSLAYKEQQIRNESRWGISNVYNLLPSPLRVVGLTFRVTSAAAAELRDGIVLRGRGGAHPMIVAPMSTEGVVVYGRLSDSWTERRVLPTVFETDLVVAEDPIVVPLS
jgi:hypothetical protein